MSLCLDSDIKTTITLITKDNVQFEVEKHLFQSTNQIQDEKYTLENASELNIVEASLKNNPEETEININILSNIFPKVLEFLTHHYNNPMKRLPHREINFIKEGDISQWDIDYIQSLVDMAKDAPPLTFLIQMIASSHWANLDSLNNLCAAKIASMIRHKSPEIIYAMMGTLTEDNCCHLLPTFVNDLKLKNDYEGMVKYAGKTFTDNFWNMTSDNLVELFIINKLPLIEQNIKNKEEELSKIEVSLVKSSLGLEDEEAIKKEMDELKDKYDSESRNRLEVLFQLKQFLTTKQKLIEELDQLKLQLEFMKNELKK